MKMQKSKFYTGTPTSKHHFTLQKHCYTKSPTSFHMWFLQKYLGVFIIFVTHCTKLATILRPNFHEEKTQKRI